LHRLRRRRALSHAHRANPRRSCLRRAHERLAAAFLRGVRLLRARCVLLGSAAVLAALVASALLALVWLFATEPGLRWALARAVQASGGALEIEGARGTLASVVTMERVRFVSPGTRIEARAVGGHAHLAAALGGRLVIEPLTIGALDIEAQA